MKRYTILLILLSGLFLVMGCDKQVYYAHEEDVDELGWNKDDALLFDVNVTDTMELYDFFIDVRNSVRYDKANAFFFINTTFPDGSIAYDTLECPLADLQGRWYGRCTGRYVDNRYYFRKHVLFPRSGNYHFEITHGMRDTNVAGLKSVGIRIVRIEK